jgi:hypothetical protein
LPPKHIGHFILVLLLPAPLGFHEDHVIARGISVSVPDCPVDTAVHLG